VLDEPTDVNIELTEFTKENILNSITKRIALFGYRRMLLSNHYV
jgi:hypothetical protein